MEHWISHICEPRRLLLALFSGEGSAADGEGAGERLGPARRPRH